MKKQASIKPNFLIIGAPRSGTTSLHDMLSHHPDLYMSAVKEPHFFSSFEFPFPENEIHHITKNLKEYQKLFAKAGDKLAGESSAHYLSDPKAAKKIKAYNPDMKLIALIREPISRAHSHYLLYARRGQPIDSFDETVAKLVRKPTGSPVYDIVRLGDYGEQLEHYYKYFKPEQLLVINFNDLTKRPVPTLRKILKHIGADPSVAEELAKANPRNQHQVPRSQALARVVNNPRLMKAGLKTVPRPLLRVVRNKVLLKKGTDKEQVNKATEVLLEKHYQADSKRLAKLLKTSPAKLWQN